MSLPKPYYEEPGVTIYNADCRDILPELPKVDLVLTDPPYGIGGNKGTLNKKRGKSNYGTNLWDDSPDYVLNVVIPIIKFSIAKNGRVILTPGSKLMFRYPEPDHIGIFWMPSGMGVSTWGWCNFQPIFYYGKDPRSGKSIMQSSKLMNSAGGIDGHPCPKPIKEWTWLLNKGSLDGETILDPFMGSGTTLVAAKSLGRRAIGIELESRYCDIAIQRLSQTYLQFTDTNSHDRIKEKQEDLFHGSFTDRGNKKENIFGKQRYENDVGSKKKT